MPALLGDDHLRRAQQLVADVVAFLSHFDDGVVGQIAVAGAVPIASATRGSNGLPLTLDCLDAFAREDGFETLAASARCRRASFRRSTSYLSARSRLSSTGRNRSSSVPRYDVTIASRSRCDALFVVLEVGRRQQELLVVLVGAGVGRGELLLQRLDSSDESSMTASPASVRSTD